MNNWQKFIATGLAASMLVLPLGDLAVSLGANAPRDPAQTKQKIGQFGVGAKIEVGLAGGELVRGSVQKIEEEAFVLAEDGSTHPRRFLYDQVDSLRLLKLSYKASGQPDPDQVRRVVAGWGSGKLVKVKLIGGTALDGRIQAVEQDHFTLSTSKQSEPTKVAYTEVQQIKGKMGTGTKIVLIAIPVGLALALAIPAAILASNED